MKRGVLQVNVSQANGDSRKIMEWIDRQIVKVYFAGYFSFDIRLDRGNNIFLIDLYVYEGCDQ